MWSARPRNTRDSHAWQRDRKAADRRDRFHPHHWADVPEPLEALTAGLMARDASRRPDIAEAVVALAAVRAAAGYE